MATETQDGITTRTALVMRATQQAKEMAFMVLIDGETTWYESRPLADACAQEAIEEANKEGYAVSVFVFKCLSQSDEKS